MDRFRALYGEFCRLSVEHLERETGTRADAVDVDVDVDTMLSLLPILERKVCALHAASDEQLLLFMKYFNYKVLSFWFLRSDAVVKSLYNRLQDEPARAHFRELFRALLASTQTLVSLNAMYRNIKQDTADIIADSKKILEIVAQVRATTCEQQAYRLLSSNYNFLVKTANKVLSDENYLLKLIALFNTELVQDRERMEEYRELFSLSAENAVHGIRCMCDVSVEAVDFAGSRYSAFFRRVLSNVLLFQTHGLNAQRFVQIVSKLYTLIHSELTQNAALAEMLSAVLDSIKDRLSVDELRQHGVRNLQSLVRYIASRREFYRELLLGEWRAREDTLVHLLQEIVTRNGVQFRESPVDVAAVLRALKEQVFSRLSGNAAGTAAEASTAGGAAADAESQSKDGEAPPGTANAKSTSEDGAEARTRPAATLPDACALQARAQVNGALSGHPSARESEKGSFQGTG